VTIYQRIVSKLVFITLTLRTHTTHLTGTHKHGAQARHKKTVRKEVAVTQKNPRRFPRTGHTALGNDIIGSRTYDRALLQAAHEGDPNAFGYLYDLWFDTLHDLAHQIVDDTQLAAEVVGEVFYTTWHRLDQILSTPTEWPGPHLYDETRALSIQSVVRPLPGTSYQEIAHAASRISDITDPTAMETDQLAAHFVATAARSLGNFNASLLNLHLRHELTPHDLGAMPHIALPPKQVERHLSGLLQRFSEAMRAQLLWAGDGPANQQLRQALTQAGTDAFDAHAFHLIRNYIRSSAEGQRLQAPRLAPHVLYASIPIPAVSSALKQTIGTSLLQQGVPLQGSIYELSPARTEQPHPTLIPPPFPVPPVPARSPRSGNLLRPPRSGNLLRPNFLLHHKHCTFAGIRGEYRCTILRAKRTPCFCSPWLSRPSPHHIPPLRHTQHPVIPPHGDFSLFTSTSSRTIHTTTNPCSSSAGQHCGRFLEHHLSPQRRPQPRPQRRPQPRPQRRPQDRPQRRFLFTVAKNRVPLPLSRTTYNATRPARTRSIGTRSRRPLCFLEFRSFRSCPLPTSGLAFPRQTCKHRLTFATRSRHRKHSSRLADFFRGLCADHLSSFFLSPASAHHLPRPLAQSCARRPIVRLLTRHYRKQRLCSAVSPSKQGKRENSNGLLSSRFFRRRLSCARRRATQDPRRKQCRGKHGGDPQKPDRPTNSRKIRRRPLLDP